MKTFYVIKYGSGYSLEQKPLNSQNVPVPDDAILFEALVTEPSSDGQPGFQETIFIADGCVIITDLEDAATAIEQGKLVFNQWLNSEE